MKYDYIHGGEFTPYKIQNKGNNIRRHILNMLIRSLGAFEYKGLPETIPSHILEMLLQVNGVAGVFEYKGDIYATRGGLGGEPNYNYEPTIFTVSNPALNFSANLKIGEECAIIKNDDFYQGMIDNYRYYATQLTENEISILLTMINTRISALISAGDDATRESAELYMKRIIEGDFSIIAENQFFDGVKVQPYTTATAQNNIKNLIEAEQYLKASWLNDIGLDANYNMKRETLTDSENLMNQNALYPYIDRLLFNRQKGIENVNKLFNTSISVKLSGEWARMREERNKQAEEKATQETEQEGDEKDDRIDENE